MDVKAGVYTKETLKPLSMTQLIGLFVKTHEKTGHTIDYFAGKIRNINKNFKRINSNIVIVKNANNVISSRYCELNKKCGEVPNAHMCIWYSYTLTWSL